MNRSNVATSIIFLVFCGAFNGNLWAQTDSLISIGKKISLTSKILKEKREIRVYTPRDYDGTFDTYPVLYLLDAGTHFRHVATMVEYMSDNLKIPQLIVVGIPNTDRVRDFTPLHSLMGLDGKIDSAIFATTGGGDNFLSFIEQELVPFIDKRYRTQPYRILEGHSLGGMFATYAMEAKPNLFQSYINISAAYYGRNKATLRNVSSFFKNHPDFGANLYVAIGDEYFTQPGVDSLVLQLKSSAPRALRWKYQRYPQEDHGSVGHPAMYDGLRFIYPDWWFDLYDLKNPPSYEMLVQHFKKMSAEYHYQINVPEQIVSALGYFYLDMKKVDDAIAAFQHNISLHPRSPGAYIGLGDAYIYKREKNLAIQNYEKSLSLNPKDEYVKKTLDDLRKEK